LRDLSQQILLIARNETGLATRIYSDILQNAGFQVSRAETLGRAIVVANSIHPDLVILEQSFAERERTAFINCLHQNHPEIPVLFLQPGLVRPDVILKSCRDILSAQPGGRTVHTIQEYNAKPA
jgi:response regulator RpfG family c-di-GMP phosphodiesterase